MGKMITKIVALIIVWAINLNFCCVWIMRSIDRNDATYCTAMCLLLLGMVIVLDKLVYALRVPSGIDKLIYILGGYLTYVPAIILIALGWNALMFNTSEYVIVSAILIIVGLVYTWYMYRKTFHPELIEEENDNV